MGKPAEEYYIGEPPPKPSKATPKPSKAPPKPSKAPPKPSKAPLVKLKAKPSAGVSAQITVKDHDEKLTKHGKKPVVMTVEKDDEKPTPHVPRASEMEYGGTKRKGAPPSTKTTILRKRPLENGPAPKRSRRVSAHEI